MNILLLKQLCILAVFAGAAGGAVALVPAFTLWVFLLLFVYPAILIIIYLKQNDLIGIINTREGAIFGALIGFVSFIAAFLIFTPVSVIVGWISSVFHLSYVPGFLRYIPFDFGSIMVLIITVIFAAFMSALFNGFGGLVTAYAYELISGLKKENNENNTVDFEIK